MSSAPSETNPPTRRQRAFAVALDAAPLEGEGDLGSGRLTWRTLVSGDRTPSDELTLGVADFPPHGELKRHRHDAAEVYFGLSGEGTVVVDDEAFALRAGVALFVPGGAEHGVVAGASGLSLLYAFARGAFADIAYRYRDATADRLYPPPASR